MKVLIDLNVLLDVVQCRSPHYQDSAAVLSLVRAEGLRAMIPAHGITTLHYIIAKAAGQAQAAESVDWLLEHFEVAAVGRETLRRARQLPFGDFEDALVASLAEATSCSHVVTRNTADFARSPVPARSPTDFLVLFAARSSHAP